MPPKSTFIFIVLLLIISFLLGYNYFSRPFENKSTPSAEVETTQPDLVEASPNAILDKLTSRQKVTQLMAMPLDISADLLSAMSGSTSSAELKWYEQNQPGVVLLFGDKVSSQSAKQTITYLDSHSLSKLNTLFAVDHEGGSVQRLTGTGFTKLPSWQQLCQQSASESGQLLSQSAKEIKKAGISMVMAPMLDFGSSSVLKSRICSSDPQVVIEKAAEYIGVFQDQGISVVVKHFPGIGKTTKDLHNQFDQIKVEPEDAEVYRRILDQFPNIGVMTAHVGVTNQYPDIPCSMSADCIKELSANYPQILVVSDALEMKSAAHIGNSDDVSLSQRAQKALLSGNQLLLFGKGVTLSELDEVVDSLSQLYDSDSYFRSIVDARLSVIQRFKENKQ